MQWDLGVQGLGLILLMSAVFGIVVQVVWGRTGRPWVALAATGAGILLGLLISEVWFGWATEEELQPNIDGVSYDEVLMGYVVAVIGVLVARLLVHGRRPWLHLNLRRPRNG